MRHPSPCLAPPVRASRRIICSCCVHTELAPSRFTPWHCTLPLARRHWQDCDAGGVRAAAAGALPPSAPAVLRTSWLLGRFAVLSAGGGGLAAARAAACERPAAPGRDGEWGACAAGTCLLASAMQTRCGENQQRVSAAFKTHPACLPACLPDNRAYPATSCTQAKSDTLKYCFLNESTRTFTLPTPERVVAARVVVATCCAAGLLREGAFAAYAPCCSFTHVLVDEAGQVRCCLCEGSNTIRLLGSSSLTLLAPGRLRWARTPHTGAVARGAHPPHPAGTTCCGGRSLLGCGAGW